MKKMIITLIVMILMCGCSSEKKEYIDMEKIKQISCEEEEALIAEGALLVDVRTKEEFDADHLKNAINIQYGAIENQIGNVTSNKADKIIVYCQSGMRSGIAAKTLVSMGYSNVYDLGSIEKCIY